MKKRLLFFSNLYPNLALPNQATFNYQQAEALSEFYDVTVVSPIPWLKREVIKKVKKSHTFGRLQVFYPTYWYVPGALHAFHGEMMLASILRTVDKIHQAQPFDLIYGAWLYPDGWVSGKLAKRWSIPCYLKVHGTDVNRLVARSKVAGVSKVAFEMADGIICVSQALRDSLVDLGAHMDKCHVVYNGINSDFFKPMDKLKARKEIGLFGSGKVILFVGNILETKGINELAVAFNGVVNCHNDVRLLIIGTGAYKSHFIDMIEQAGVSEKVELLGSVEHNKIGIFMNAADLLCLPSYMEGVPNAVLEALACDTKVVATEVGGIPELAAMDDRVTLVPPRNSRSLQLALEQVLNDDNRILNRKFENNTWSQNAAAVASIMSRGEVTI